jgi:hypothetical protein
MQKHCIHKYTVGGSGRRPSAPIRLTSALSRACAWSAVRIVWNSQLFAAVHDDLQATASLADDGFISIVTAACLPRPGLYGLIATVGITAMSRSRHCVS